MFEQYDSINTLISKEKENISDDIKQKANNIIQKINIIYGEFKDNPELNIKNLSLFIDNLFQNKKIENNKNLAQNADKVEENKSITKEAINKINKIDLNSTNKKKEKNNSQNINSNAQNQKINTNINKNSNLNKELEKISKQLNFSEKEIDKNKSQDNTKSNLVKLIGKKRTRAKDSKDRKNKESNNLEKKIIQKNKNKEKEKEKEKDNKKNISNRKIKREKTSNKVNEKNQTKNILKEQNSSNKNIIKININNRQLKKPKKDQNKTSTSRITTNSNKNTPIKNKEVKTRRNYSKNSNNSSPKIKNKKEVKSPNKRKSPIKPQNKEDDNKQIKKKNVKSIEEKDKYSDENSTNKIYNNENKNIIVNENVNNTNQKPKLPKSKKKGKGKRNQNFIIDEELKKSTPIRNLKKQPKGILKKTNLTQPFILNSPPPKAYVRSKSSEKKVTFSSDKNKKHKTFLEIFQSPSKLKATPLKRKINSEKKSSHKKNNILIFEENKNEVKYNFVGKKRNISFNDERIVKEYNPKTPVREVKTGLIRKSPLERKKNQNINLN